MEKSTVYEFEAKRNSDGEFVCESFSPVNTDDKEQQQQQQQYSHDAEQSNHQQSHQQAHQQQYEQEQAQPAGFAQMQHQQYRDQDLRQQHYMSQDYQPDYIQREHRQPENLQQSQTVNDPQVVFGSDAADQIFRQSYQSNFTSGHGANVDYVDQMRQQFDQMRQSMLTQMESFTYVKNIKDKP